MYGETAFILPGDIIRAFAGCVVPQHIAVHLRGYKYPLYVAGGRGAVDVVPHLPHYSGNVIFIFIRLSIRHSFYCAPLAFKDRYIFPLQFELCKLQKAAARINSNIHEFPFSFRTDRQVLPSEPSQARRRSLPMNVHYWQ